MKKVIFNALMDAIKNGMITDEKVIDKIFEEEFDSSHEDLWVQYLMLRREAFVSELMNSSDSSETDMMKILSAFGYIEDNNGESHVECGFVNEKYLRNAKSANETAEAAFANKDEFLMYCDQNNIPDRVSTYILKVYRVSAITKEIIDKTMSMIS